MRAVPKAASVWPSKPAGRGATPPKAWRRQCVQAIAAMPQRFRALQADDFRRVLATRPCARTAHFALYHASDRTEHEGADLSTPMTLMPSEPVDDRARLGLVVPKRLARRAVTRNLVKRQARALFAAREADIGPWTAGDWVIRQSRGFEVQQFGSASSQALRAVLGSELRQLLAAARPAIPRGDA